jgi:hypothetical protein
VIDLIQLLVLHPQPRQTPTRERLPNIRFAAFADEDTIQRRLEAADFHLGSLRLEYTGVVVPSKFFAALAVGRLFIFAGTDDTSVAQWIRQHDVGLVLEPGRGGRGRRSTARAQGRSLGAPRLARRLVRDLPASLFEAPDQ